MYNIYNLEYDDDVSDIMPGVSFSSDSTVDRACKLHFMGII